MMWSIKNNKIITQQSNIQVYITYNQSEQKQPMSDLGNRLKQTIQDQSLNMKFMELLNSNRPIETIKDRQILPTVPLSSFNISHNQNIVPLPSINKQKNTSKNKIKTRSISQAKFKYNNQAEVGLSMAGITIANHNPIIKSMQGIVKGSQQHLTSDRIILTSTKNLVKIRNKSVQSAKRLRSEKQKQQIRNTQLSTSKKQSNANHPNSHIQFQVPSHKLIIQKQHTTPQKFKIDHQVSNTHSTHIVLDSSSSKPNNRLVNNKTIAEISNQAMQNIMLNIKFGKIQQNISYKSFLKKDVQPTPMQIIKKLEGWLNKYKIKSGLIHSRNLQKIFALKSIPNNMILSQFVNYQQLKKQMDNTIPGLKYYTTPNKQKGRNLAAIKIQSIFRMKLEMNYVKKLKSLMNKVKIIQRQWKVAIAYRRGRQQRMRRVQQKIKKAKQLNSGLVKNWDLIKSSRRVQIHICSIALEEFKRLSIADIQQRQISQLTRIFKCQQTDCTVIYVTPFALTANIMRYYERVFQFGNKAGAFRQRLYVISLQKILQKISPNLTSVSALLYDNENLKRIRQLIKDCQAPVMGQICAYIVPSYPSNQYTNLSAQLQVPIFSGPQSVCKLHSSKSGHYQFLKSLSQSLGDKCPFILPKTIHGIYSQKQLTNTLSVLIYKNKQIKKWILKIDDEINGRGLAYLNVDSLAFLKELRKQQNQQGSSQELRLPQKQMIGLIADELHMKLRLRLKIVHRQIYNDYNSYISHFLTRGGFIQACIQPQSIQAKSQKPVQHSISFKIEPNGQFKIITTYSRLQLGHKIINSSIECPSQITPDKVDSQKIVRALYRHLWTKNKLFGFFTIDLLCVVHSKTTNKQGQKDLEANNKCYAIGLDCFLNQKTSSTFASILTSMCQYNKQENKYYVNHPINKQVKQMGTITSRSSTVRSVTQLSLYDNESEIMENTKSRITKKQEQKNMQVKKQLYYLYCPFIKISNLPSIPQFFKMCKFANISFDIQSKIGTLFLLQGGLQNGCLGFICTGNTQQKMREQTLRLIQFLSKEFRSKNNKKSSHKGVKIKQGSDQIGQLRGFLLNSLRKNKVANNFRRQDLNLQMIF